MANFMIIVDGLTPCDLNTIPCSTNHVVSRGWLMNDVLGLPIDSLTCISTLLGVDKERIPQGRAYLEAMAKEIPLREKDIVFRCNLVAWENNKLLTANAQGLSTSMKEQIFTQIANSWVSPHLKIYPLGGYRGLVVWQGDKELVPSSNFLPPHEHIGENRSLLENRDMIPTELKQFLTFCEEKLGKILSNEKQMYALYLWSCAGKTEYPKFQQLHHHDGIMLTATPIVQGIAKAMEMPVITQADWTGDVDTCLEGKANFALSVKDQYQTVVLHINGADEAAHRREPKEKQEFWDQIQNRLLHPILSHLSSSEKLLVCTDHGTCPETGKHLGGWQPFWVYTSKNSSPKELGYHAGSEVIKIITDM